MVQYSMTGYVWYGTLCQVSGTVRYSSKPLGGHNPEAGLNVDVDVDGSMD